MFPSLLDFVGNLGIWRNLYNAFYNSDIKDKQEKSNLEMCLQAYAFWLCYIWLLNPSIDESQ